MKKPEAFSEKSDLLCKMASTIRGVQDFVEEHAGKGARTREKTSDTRVESRLRLQ